MSKRVRIENVERSFMILLTFIIVFLLVLGKSMVRASADVKMVMNDGEQPKVVVASNDNLSQVERIGKSCIAALELDVKNALKSNEEKVEKKDKALNQESTPSFYSEDEVILMAKLINREACYEPYEGQVAVGATVVNRLNKARELGYNWKTITEIIKEPGQYDNGIPVENYTYNEENYNAALDALNGVDPTKGAVYYYNPDMSNDTFIPSHILSIVIGHHYFYYMWEK